MASTLGNAFGTQSTLKTPAGDVTIFSLDALEKAGVGPVGRLPFSIKVLLESALRNVDNFSVTEDHVRKLANWSPEKRSDDEIPFKPSRVILQDFTGVPCLVDLAAMRDAMKSLGGDPRRINPLVPCDLVIDHSVQVDESGSRVALSINGEKEFTRNRERYEFLKWGQQSVDNFRVVPPATGIVHQVNLEYLAQGVLSQKTSGRTVAFPDSVVGTDSHTTMINGLGVVGWGVGGIEAEAVMLGQPIYMVMPEVIGFRLIGRLPEGSTATDLVLTVTQLLRAHGVVDKFVEFCGAGLAALSVPDRATIANMAPEYGATMGFFPVDGVTLDFLRFTGRDEKTVALVESYCKANGLFWSASAAEPKFNGMLELDLATVQPSLAGPRRPQDRVRLGDMGSQWRKELTGSFGRPAAAYLNESRWVGEGGALVSGPQTDLPAATQSGGNGGAATAVAEAPSCPVVSLGGKRFRMTDGDVVIAAITSCTNTSNPDVMIAAGLLARKARARGLTSKPWVKTSLAPGSKVVTEYFDKAGLSEDLNALGFYTVGYGCTTCIGNSGPLPDAIVDGVKQGDLVVASVLSGNRNFEGRINPDCKANYLASPPLVVAYALAGTVDIDLTNEPLGNDPAGKAVFLKDIWPTHEEVQRVKAQCVTPEQFRKQYAHVFDGNPTWNAVAVSESESYPWSEDSTYIQNPPFFEGMTATPAPIAPIHGARCLVFVGHSVTTDHISPAGAISEKSPAGQYLISRGVSKVDFNSYGSRRGNDRVMTRGTFANVRVKNMLAAETGADGASKIREGGWTRDFSKVGGGRVDWIFNASVNYKNENTPLVVLAGKDYGMGSSRDWAAKGALLLGVRAVIAESYERIHRSNLVGMGVLPLQFQPGQTPQSLGITGYEVFDIPLPQQIKAGQTIDVTAVHPETGKKTSFSTICRIDTPVEIDYYRNGGVLPTVLRAMLKNG